MAKKDQLREFRSGTVIIVTSKAQEKDIRRALNKVVDRLREFASVALVHQKQSKPFLPKL